MEFSIIVPVYNIEDKIYKCLDSIRNQTFNDFEVLIIVDGATDNSKAICDKFQNLDERFCVYYKENGGLVSARKYGAALAKGDYVINVDGDDYVDKEYLISIDKILSAKKYDMISCGYREIQGEKIKEYFNSLSCGEYQGNQITKIRESILYDRSKVGFQGGCLVNTVWTKIVKRDIYCKCQNLIPNHISIGEDLLLNAILASRIETLYVLNYSFYNYVVYQSSMMHTYNLDNFKHYLDVSKELNSIRYINEEDVNVYLLQAFISEIRKVSKYSKSYSDFISIVKDQEDIQDMLKIAKKAKIEKINSEFLIKKFLVIFSNWFLIYTICRNS